MHHYHLCEVHTMLLTLAPLSMSVVEIVFWPSHGELVASVDQRYTPATMSNTKQLITKSSFYNIEKMSLSSLRMLCTAIDLVHQY